MADITEAYINEFKNVIEQYYQQDGSRLLSTVRVEPQNSEIMFFDRIKPRVAKRIVGRNVPTDATDGEYDRRANRWERWGDRVRIDPTDLGRMLASPVNAESEAIGKALGRAMDEVIIEAATGIAYGGKQGTTPIPYNPAKRIAADFGELPATNVGLTLAKLREARLRLRQTEFLGTNDMAICVISAKQMDDLLAISQTTSADFNTVRTLVNGRVDTFMGFRFIETELLDLLDVGGELHREVLCYTPNSICMGVNKGIELTVDRDYTTSNSTLIQAYAHFGATRHWEDGVIAIRCKE